MLIVLRCAIKAPWGSSFVCVFVFLLCVFDFFVDMRISVKRMIQVSSVIFQSFIAKLQRNIQLTYLIFDILRFSHSSCGSPPVKTYVNKRTLFEEKWLRTEGLNQQSLDPRSNALHTELYSLVGIHLYRRRPTIRITEA